MFGLPFIIGIIAPYLSPLKWVAKVWGMLPAPIKILILLLITWFASALYTNHKAEQRFAEIIRQSNENAVAIDRKVEADAKQRMETELQRAREEKLNVENKLAQFAVEYQTLKDNCNVDEELLKRSDSIDDGSIGRELSKPTVSTPRKTTPPPRKHHPRPNNVSPSKGG